MHIVWGEGTYVWQRFPASETNPECRPGLNAIYIRQDSTTIPTCRRPRLKGQPGPEEDPHPSEDSH